MKIAKKIKSASSIMITFREKVVARLFAPENSRKMAKKRLSELSKTAIVNDGVAPIDENWDALK